MADNFFDARRHVADGDADDRPALPGVRPSTCPSPRCSRTLGWRDLARVAEDRILADVEGNGSSRLNGGRSSQHAQAATAARCSMPSSVNVAICALVVVYRDSRRRRSRRRTNSRWVTRIAGLKASSSSGRAAARRCASSVSAARSHSRKPPSSAMHRSPHRHVVGVDEVVGGRAARQDVVGLGVLVGRRAAPAPSTRSPDSGSGRSSSRPPDRASRRRSRESSRDRRRSRRR